MAPRERSGGGCGSYDFEVLTRPPKRVKVNLRHTAASHLLVRGVHPKVVQELLGHSTITLTLDTYSHVIPSMSRDAARHMQGFFAAIEA